MMTHGNTIVVATQEEYERLLALPTSLAGWFDPATAHGVVQFATPAVALTARREA